MVFVLHFYALPVGMAYFCQSQYTAQRIMPTLAIGVQMIFINQGDQLGSILCKQLLMIGVSHSRGLSWGVCYVLG